MAGEGRSCGVGAVIVSTESMMDTIADVGRRKGQARMAASAGDGLGQLIRSNGSLRRALRQARPLRRWRAATA